MTSIRNPESLRRIWQQSRFEAQRAERLTEEIGRWDANIAEVTKTLAELKAERADKARQCQLASDQAHDFDELVRAACAANGWAVPEEPADIPLNETGQFPAVAPADRSFTVGPINPYAATIWGHVKIGQTVRVHWVGGGGIEGLVRYLAGDRMVVETADSDYDLSPDPTDIARVEVIDTEVREAGNGADFYACDHETTDDPGHGKHCPRKTEAQLAAEFGFQNADLDQVAATPAATTLPDEAVRTDG